MNNSMNNPLQLIGELKKFISSGITADKAEEIVRGKINSGEMSMEQFEQLKSQAQQFQNMLSFMK
jgi:hypothetical protein